MDSVLGLRFSAEFSVEEHDTSGVTEISSICPTPFLPRRPGETATIFETIPAGVSSLAGLGTATGATKSVGLL